MPPNLKIYQANLEVCRVEFWREAFRTVFENVEGWAVANCVPGFLLVLEKDLEKRDFYYLQVTSDRLEFTSDKRGAQNQADEADKGLYDQVEWELFEFLTG